MFPFSHNNIPTHPTSLAEPNFMEGLRHISQVLPSTPLLQKHRPVSLSHRALCAEVLTPGKKQAQAERSKNKNKNKKQTKKRRKELKKNWMLRPFL